MNTWRIDRFFSKEGVLLAWPSRKSRNNQLAALRRVATAFETGREYNERQVNDILKSRLAFEDYVLVRRELIDMGMLRRSRDCRKYWLSPPSDPAGNCSPDPNV